MPNPVEGLHEVNEDMVEVLLYTGDISHRGFVGWRSALWCSFLLWSLPVLQRWSPLLTSIYFWGHWWSWLFRSFRTAAGCLSREVWWLRTGSTGLAILQSARSYCRLSWERWLDPPSAWTSSAGMLSTPADFPFFNDCATASTSLRRMGWSSSVSVWGQSSTDVSPLVLWLYSSVQYSVHRFSVSRSSVKHFPERSWTVVAFPCFTVVKSFASWYALLLLFFLRCF